MKDPIISVIIPVYNAEKTLAECIGSVLSQKGVDLEIIAVDDGSTDSSYSILAEYARRYPFIKTFRTKNEFAGATRNKGIDAARGEYLAFLDSDDVMLDGCLAFMLRKIRSKRAEVLKTGFIYRDEGSGELYRTLYSMNSSINPAEKLFTTSFRKCSHRTLGIADVPWNGLYLRRFVTDNRIRFNGLRCVNDHSFFIECLIKAKRVAVTSTPTVSYRIGQSDSLIGKKAYYFENQIASYNIVKELTAALPEKLRRRILQRELHGLFGWYERLLTVTADSALDEKLDGFLASFDEDDVGIDFLRSFTFSGIYYGKKYGTDAPKRPSVIRRGLTSLKENGLKFTIHQLLNKSERKFKV